MEMDQKHLATITKDRTGKFQDETIEKPGEEFGIALHDWLTSGKALKPEATAEKPAAKPQKTKTATDKPKTEKTPVTTTTGSTLKEQSDTVIKEIANIITAEKDGTAFFNEEEKEEARQIVKGTRLDEKGIADLRDFKVFLSDELSKRETKIAA
jgi:hypothetical protein